MTQIHKRFTIEQVKVLFQGYLQGNQTRAAIEELLGIDKTRIIALLKAYRRDLKALSIAYHRPTPSRLSNNAEAEIRHEMLREKAQIKDKNLPIYDFKYSALADRLKKKGVQISTSTITRHAITLEC